MVRNNKIIEAQDGLPFYINGNKTIDGAIWDKDNARAFSPEAKALSTFADSIIPISIFGSDLKDDDTDSKLAYSPFENQPYCFKTDDGDVYQKVWQAGRYVGATQIGDTNIEIQPRFGNGWLEYILDDVTHFKVVESGSDANKNSHDLNDLMRRILWHMWVRKFASADKYGLPKHVVKRTHVGMQICGHLNVRKSLFPLFTKSQVVSEYREKDIDDAICRIVYKAYCILVNRKFNKTQVPSQIQDSLNTLYGYYLGQPISVSANDYNKLGYKSIYLSWRPLVDFSWQIIRQDSLFKQRGSKDESFSIFFDMAEIWEAFLRKKLGEGLEGWRVWSVEECKQKIYKHNFFGRTIIPDILLERTNEEGKKEIIVFDAKYKHMRGIKANVKNSDVDRSDLFQIHTYIQYVQHHLGNVVLGGLLYPISRKGYNDDGTPYEYSEDEVIDTNNYHADNLFGVAGRDNNPQIPFIIDGIYCSEKDDKESMNNSVEAMIARIRDTLNKPH